LLHLATVLEDKEAIKELLDNGNLFEDRSNYRKLRKVIQNS